MERHVKERLIGAAVLVAAAVILIPEMLSGPHREAGTDSTAQARAQDGEQPLKTYTIDLSQPPSAGGAASPVIEESAPPPETAEPEADAGADPAQDATPDEASPESVSVENTSGDAISEPVGEPPAPAPSSVAAATPPPAREASPRAQPATPKAPEKASERVVEKPTGQAPSGKGWAVQLASFGEEADANAMRKRLRDKGYDAFVMPFRKGSTTWYRVRIGPVKTRQAADELLTKVKQVKSDSIVVPHP